MSALKTSPAVEMSTFDDEVCEANYLWLVERELRNFSTW